MLLNVKWNLARRKTDMFHTNSVIINGDICVFRPDCPVKEVPVYWTVYLKIQMWGQIYCNPLLLVYTLMYGTICGRQDPGEPHVGPMNFAIWADSNNTRHILWWVGAETGFSWWITTGFSWWITKGVSLWYVCYLYNKLSAIWLLH